MQKIVVLQYGVLVFLSAAACLAANQDFLIRVDGWIGVDAWSGDATYEIGGWTEQNGVLERNHFPVSRLEWPISTVGLQFGGLVGWSNWDIQASFGVAQNDDAGTMKDSDWEIPDATDVLTTYSESDTELSAWQVDASARYWVPFRSTNPEEKIRLGGGVGILYQNFDWTARNTDQWYPQNPDLGHDVFVGDVITYELQTLMPYVQIAAQFKYRRLFGEARLGLAPWVQVEDVDDHKLRYIRAETTSDGRGAFAEVVARYAFADDLFLQISLWSMSFETSGTEEDYVYDGEDLGTRWKIQHEVRSTQLRAMLAGGFTF